MPSIVSVTPENRVFRAEEYRFGRMALRADARYRSVVGSSLPTTGPNIPRLWVDSPGCVSSHSCSTRRSHFSCAPGLPLTGTKSIVHRHARTDGEERQTEQRRVIRACRRRRGCPGHVSPLELQVLRERHRLHANTHHDENHTEPE